MAFLFFFHFSATVVWTESLIFKRIDEADRKNDGVDHNEVVLCGHLGVVNDK